jgi:hypothetical protein
MLCFAKNLTTVRVPGHNALSMFRIQVLETTCEAISYKMHLKGISKAFCSQRESCCGFGDKIHSCPRPYASKKIRTDLIFYFNFVILKNENTAQTSWTISALFLQCLCGHFTKYPPDYIPKCCSFNIPISQC